MAISSAIDCNILNDKLFKKMSAHRVVDQYGNVFIPWHRWHLIVKRYFQYNTNGNEFMYWSNDPTLTKNGAEPKVVELPIEIARLTCAKIITKEEFENIILMIKSEDKENLSIALEIIRNYRKIRLKQGKRTK